MADETPEKLPETPPPPPKPSGPSVEEQLASLRAENEGLKTVVKSIADRHVPAQPAGPSLAGLHPAIVSHCRTKGMTDAEIEKNAPLIWPIVEAALGLAGQELVGMIGTTNEKVEEILVSTAETMTEKGPVKEYPHYNLLKQDIQRLRDQAKRDNQPLTLKAAYATAVVNNLAKIVESEREETHREESAPARRAAAASADVGSRGARRSTTESSATPKSADDLLGMSREDRKKWFEQHQDAPL